MVQGTKISIENVSKSYGKTEVIPKLSASLGAGDFTVILGPSGCGKSTLLNLLAGLEELTSGKILFGDREVQDVPARDRGCAMVFQNYALYPHMSVMDNIGYSLKLAKVSKQNRIERIEQVAKVTGLTGLLDRRPSQLSGGQRQRVAIARAIIREPDVLLFDEPLSNLDAQLRHDMRLELSELHKRIGATSVFVTHDQVEAMTLADKILVINKGKIEQFASPEEVYHRPATTFVASFIGAPSMNMIEVCGAKGVLRLPDGSEIARHIHEGPAILGIRPEKIELADIGLSAQVIYREDLGSHVILVVRLKSGQELKISTLLGETYTGAAEVKLGISVEHIHLFDPLNYQRLKYDKE